MSATQLQGTPQTSKLVRSATRKTYVPASSQSFAHDHDGNLEQDGRWDYRWDAENRLIRMETRVSIATVFPELKKRLTFIYDANGRRIRKTVENWDTTLNSGAGDWAETLDLLFLYDGWNLLTELDANNGNALVRSHAWGLDLSGSLKGAGGVGGLLWTSTPIHTFAPCFDGNGNATAWINTGTLAVSGRADYGAFGEVVMLTGVANTLPFGFSTKYADGETGLLYYGYRYLDTSNGRWLSKDLIEEKGGLNLYGMVGNNPLDYWDFIGLDPLAIFVVGADDSLSTRSAYFREASEQLKSMVERLNQALQYCKKEYPELEFPADGVGFRFTGSFDITPPKGGQYNEGQQINSQTFKNLNEIKNSSGNTGRIPVLLTGGGLKGKGGITYPPDGIVIDTFSSSPTTLAHETGHFAKGMNNDMHINKPATDLDSPGNLRKPDACPNEEWCKKVADLIKEIKRSLK